MSEEIVDRLTAEGQLIRNTGTNSIRAVRIQMDKFESIFETISEQITLQTRLLTDMVENSMDQLRIDEEQAERERARKQKEELALAQDEVQRAPSVEADSARGEAREGPGLFSMLSNIGLGGLTKFLIGGSLLSGGLFAIYNVAKGFIDEMYDGAWTNFETKLVDMLSGIDFESIKNAFSDLLTGVVAAVASIASLSAAILALRASTAAVNLGNALRGPALPPAAPQAATRTPPRAAAGGALGRAATAAGRLAWPAAVAGLAYQFYDLWQRGPLPEEERAALGAETEALAERVSEFPEEMAVPPTPVDPAQAAADRAAIAAETEALAARAPEFPQEMSVPPIPVDPLEASRKQLESLQETRQKMFDDADENAATSSVYIEPDTSRIDRQIEEAKQNIENILNQRSSQTDVPLEIIPPSPTTLDNSSLLRSISSPEDIIRGNDSLENIINERLSAAVEAAGINMPIIVNNNPTVAPVINNVQGGPNINSTSIFGSGGGDRSRNPYGITNGAN